MDTRQGYRDRIGIDGHKITGRLHDRQEYDRNAQPGRLDGFTM